ncbi:hypothetical protein [Streptomyces poriferorum]|uniref:hypothetical protein n=1 Tax=Streptomyces poriferorum TaxID=2798799 RepID=UPI0035327541
MVDDGLFERFPKPDIVLGQHVGPLPAGFIGHGNGPVMAAADSVNITLHGRGATGPGRKRPSIPCSWRRTWSPGSRASSPARYRRRRRPW